MNFKEDCRKRTEKIEEIDGLVDKLMKKGYIKNSIKLEYRILEEQLDSWVKQWR